MIKVPGTEEGSKAIRRLIADGVNVNVTLLFAVDAYARVSEAYLTGLEERMKSGGDLHNVGSVASFFVSRWASSTVASASLATFGDTSIET